MKNLMNNTIEVLPYIEKYYLEVQSSFEYCRDINDVDEGKTFVDFLKEDIRVIEKEGRFLGALTIDSKPSLRALGYSVYLHPRSSPRDFYELIEGCSLYLLREMLNRDIYNIYFNVANEKIAKIVDTVTRKVSDKHKIYENYIVVYCEFNRKELLYATGDED